MEFLALIGGIIEWFISRWIFFLILIILGIWKLAEIVLYLINHVKIIN